MAQHDRPRLARLLDEVREARAGLRSLAESWADTTNPAERMVLTVLAGIAEFERALFQERTGAGRAAVQQRGVHFGRAAKLSAEQIAFARRLLEEGTTAGEVVCLFRVYRATLYRVLATIPAIGSSSPEGAAVPWSQAMCSGPS